MRYIIRRRYVSHAIAMFAFSFEKPQFVFIFCIFRRFLNLNICKKKLEIRSVERGISPVAKFTMNELFL